MTELHADPVEHDRNQPSRDLRFSSERVEAPAGEKSVPSPILGVGGAAQK
jgi:hypothetical protein